MNRIKHITLLILVLLFFVTLCQSQNRKHRETLYPKVKQKLDSLYPKATISIVLYGKYLSDTTQEIDVNCHCQETVGTIILIFDTNANLLNKEVHYYGSLNGLPDSILNYIKKNESPTVKFDKKNSIKYYNNKGEISFGIYMSETGASGYNSYDEYILKFKPTGELISRERQELEER